MRWIAICLALVVGVVSPDAKAMNLFKLATEGIDMDKVPITPPPSQTAPKAAPKVVQQKQQQYRPRHAPVRDAHEVTVSYNDELFIINGEKFEAKTYCFDIEKGDMVIFIEGNAFGACAWASFVNLRTKDVCEVWCE